ncbi:MULTISPECIES: serine hydrolase [unclassified Amycolatopsis]|uniref:serine hydrolase domain-containing protein n=1 Tax=unclassified Amycolatopsis TaxID=2618356 RepID=UPI00106E2725|nr:MULTISPECIES: serine hydrolase domain-containing protein [unclassified Amycolatopsis]
MENIEGTVRPGFEQVRDTFAAVADGAAQLVAYHRGERVVDLWTGVDGDCLLGAYSATKGAAHLVVALLVQDGVLDLDQRVRHYWPEFSADVTLRDLLAHRAGLVGADEGFSRAELADDRIVAERLARQRPFWRPGTAFGYHALVIGALSGEVVLRATGRTIQEHFAERVRDPYAVDFYLGLPAELEPRFASAEPMILTPERQIAPPAANSLNGIAFNRHHPDGPEVWELPNLPEVRRLGPASFGGVASARGLARMYAAAISPLGGEPPLLKPETAAEFAQIQSTGDDVVLHQRKAFGIGFHATSEYYPELGQGSFGHSGAGGQQAFADPRNGVAYGYTRRRIPFPAAAAPENEPLIKALYSALRAVESR